MFAHDASHVIYGCDTDMYDEIKILPLTFSTSDFKFRDYLRERKNPAVDVMYDDLIKRHGVLWLYSSILVVLPQLLPELILMWSELPAIFSRASYPTDCLIVEGFRPLLLGLTSGQ